MKRPSTTRRWLCVPVLLLLALPSAADARRKKKRKAPSGPPPPTVDAPESVALASGEGVPVLVMFDQPPERPVLTVTVGRVEELKDEGEGSYSAVYFPPPSTDQVLVMMAAWDDAHPGLPGLARIWLEHPEDAPPARGVRVAVVVVPNRVPSEGDPATVLLFLHDEKGKPRNMWAQVEAQRGKIGKTKRKGGGVYVCPYRPPRVVGMGLDTISASVGDIVGWADVIVEGIRPDTFEVRVDPEKLVADGTSKAKVTVRLGDAAGEPMPGQPVRLEAVSGELGEVEDKGDGTYVAGYTAPETLPPDGRVAITALVGDTAEGVEAVTQEGSIELVPGPAHHANVWAEPRRLPADGTSKATLWVALLDEYGNPAAETPDVILSRGELPGVDPEEAGRWKGTWTAPKLPDLEYSERIEPQVRVGGKPLPVKGTLRLDPVPAPPKPPERPRPNELWGADVGWAMLFGGGHVADTNGLAVDWDWAWQVVDLPFYLGGDGGVTLLTMETSASDEQFAATTVRAEVTTALVPLMGTATLRVRPFSRLYVRAGLGLGALVVWTSVESKAAFGGTATRLQVVPAAAVPVAVEYALGPGLASFEVQLFRTIGDLSGVTERGVGVSGVLQGVVTAVGWRWSEP